MAKKKSRILIRLACQECKRQNYTTQKSKISTKEKLVLKRYCRFCRKHTKHKEVK